MQNDSADELDVEMAHSKRAKSRFTNEGKGGDNCRLERVQDLLLVLFFELRICGFFPALQPPLPLGSKSGSARREVGVGELLHLRLEHVDLVHDRLNALDVALVLGADEARNDVIYDSFDLHLSWSSHLLADEPAKTIIGSQRRTAAESSYYSTLYCIRSREFAQSGHSRAPLAADEAAVYYLALQKP